MYSIVLHSNDEEHSVPIEQLENINGLPLSMRDDVIDAMQRSLDTMMTKIQTMEGEHLPNPAPLHSLTRLEISLHQTQN